MRTIFDHSTISLTGLDDLSADSEEVNNLAYFAEHGSTRGWLLATVLRDWNVTVVGPLDQTRWQRAEWLRKLTGYRRNWWK